jgi:hypothetical protein
MRNPPELACAEQLDIKAPPNGRGTGGEKLPIISGDPQIAMYDVQVVW